MYMWHAACEQANGSVTTPCRTGQSLAWFPSRAEKGIFLVLTIFHLTSDVAVAVQIDRFWSMFQEISSCPSHSAHIFLKASYCRLSDHTADNNQCLWEALKPTQQIPRVRMTQPGPRTRPTFDFLHNYEGEDLSLFAGECLPEDRGRATSHKMQF